MENKINEKENLNYTIISIRESLYMYLKQNKLKSLVIGVSGGIDSAICAALARPICDELGIKLYGRSIPITTNTSEEIRRARKVGEAFCHDFEEVDNMGDVFENFWNTQLSKNEYSYEKENNNTRKIRRGNVKARLRMIYLYDLARLHNGIVLSTDNYTELLLGFWTLHGDCGDFGMVQNLWKTEVYDLAEYISNSLLEDDLKKAIALRECIECQATDGLGITNTDLDQILPGWKGTSREGYVEVDKILFSYLIGVKNINEALIEDHPVIKRHLATSFKRDNPFNLKRETIVKK